MMFVLRRLLVASCVAAAALTALVMTPATAVAQQSAPVTLKPISAEDHLEGICGTKPGFECGKEVCFEACMSPQHWKICATKTWFADSYDHLTVAPLGATLKNDIRFRDRCGTFCARMGSPRLGYLAKSGVLSDGTLIPAAWVVFPFSPPRKK